LFIKDGTPVWKQTFKDVATPVGLYYSFQIPYDSAKNKEYIMYYSTSLVTQGGCVAPADCSSWLEYHPVNRTYEGIPPKGFYQSGCKCQVKVDAYDEMRSYAPT